MRGNTRKAGFFILGRSLGQMTKETSRCSSVQTMKTRPIQKTICVKSSMPGGVRATAAAVASPCVACMVRGYKKGHSNSYVSKEGVKNHLGEVVHARRRAGGRRRGRLALRRLHMRWPEGGGGECRIMRNSVRGVKSPMPGGALATAAAVASPCVAKRGGGEIKIILLMRLV